MSTGVSGKIAPMTTQLGPIGQVSRQVDDIERAVHWYGTVLGLPHLYTFGPLAFFDCGGTRLYLNQREPDEAAGAESLLYFRVENIHAAHADLVSRGVVFVQEPKLIHRHESGVEEWMAFFDDPEGRPLALMAQTGG
jgi:predicted enzyme related to lactoylglutathione lyase